MIRSTVSRLKKVWAITFVPRLLRGDLRYTPGKFKILPPTQNTPTRSKSTDGLHGNPSAEDRTNSGIYEIDLKPKCGTHSDSILGELPLRVSPDISDDVATTDDTKLYKCNSACRCDDCNRVIAEIFYEEVTVPKQNGPKSAETNEADTAADNTQNNELGDSKNVISQLKNVIDDPIDTLVQNASCKDLPSLYKATPACRCDECNEGKQFDTNLKIDILSHISQVNITDNAGNDKLLTENRVQLDVPGSNAPLSEPEEACAITKDNFRSVLYHEIVLMDNNDKKSDKKITAYQMYSNLYDGEPEDESPKEKSQLEFKTIDVKIDTNKIDRKIQARTDPFWCSVYETAVGENCVYCEPTTESTIHSLNMYRGPHRRVTKFEDTLLGKRRTKNSPRELERILYKNSVAIKKNTFKASTKKQGDEKLVQKIEHVEETPLVPTEKSKVEGFLVTPRVLGQAEKAKVSNYSTLDEVAKQCLTSPHDQIDEILLREMEKLGIPLTAEKTTSGSKIGDKVRADTLNLSKKTDRPPNEEIEFENPETERKPAVSRLNVAKRFNFTEDELDNHDVKRKASTSCMRKLSMTNKPENLDEPIKEPVSSKSSKEAEEDAIQETGLVKPIVPDEKKEEKIPVLCSKYQTMSQSSERRANVASDSSKQGWLHWNVDKQPGKRASGGSAETSEVTDVDPNHADRHWQKDQFDPHHVLTCNETCSISPKPFVSTSAQRCLEGTEVMFDRDCDEHDRVHKGPKDYMNQRPLLEDLNSGQSVMRRLKCTSDTYRNTFKPGTIQNSDFINPTESATIATAGGTGEQVMSGDSRTKNKELLDKNAEEKPGQSTERSFIDWIIKPTEEKKETVCSHASELQTRAEPATEIPKRELHEVQQDSESDIHSSVDPTCDNYLVETTNEQLQATSEQLQATTEQLLATCEQLQATSEQLQAASVQLQVTSDNLYNSSDKLQAATEHLFDSTEYLHSTTEQLNSASDKIRETTEQLDFDVFNLMNKVPSDAVQEPHETCNKEKEPEKNDSPLLKKSKEKQKEPDENLGDVNTIYTCGKKPLEIKTEASKPKIEPNAASETPSILPVNNSITASVVSSVANNVFNAKTAKLPEKEETPDVSTTAINVNEAENKPAKEKETSISQIENITQTTALSPALPVSENMNATLEPLPEETDKMKLSDLMRLVQERNRLVECHQPHAYIKPIARKVIPPLSRPRYNPPSFKMPGYPEVKPRPKVCLPRRGSEKPKPTKCSSCDLETLGLNQHLGLQVGYETIETYPTEVIFDQEPEAVTLVDDSIPSDLTEEIIRELQSLGNALGSIFKRGKETILETAVLSRYPQRARFKPKDYEPWSPIPSWPYHRKQERKKLQCPKDGCKIPPPRSVQDLPCGLKPCETFPTFPRRTFSLLDYYPVSFADHKVVDLGEF